MAVPRCGQLGDQPGPPHGRLEPPGPTPPRQTRAVPPRYRIPAYRARRRSARRLGRPVSRRARRPAARGTRLRRPRDRRVDRSERGCHADAHVPLARPAASCARSRGGTVMSALHSTGGAVHERGLELAAAAIDFELTRAEAAELAAHLGSCPTCGRRAGGMRTDALALSRPFILLP